MILDIMADPHKDNLSNLTQKFSHILDLCFGKKIAK